jgi:hypothetical protein
MGNDGGSIPKRRELVKEAARNPTAAEQKETQQEQQHWLWTTDPITNEPLEEPIVSDCNGRLYKKESVLKVLTGDESINKAEAEKATFGAIKGLKDVVDVKFEVDPQAEKGPQSIKWMCPITNKPLGPGSKAAYLVPCGHAFSGAAIKEVADGKCLKCGEAYAPNDVITIIPTSGEDIARLALRMNTLKEKGLTHSLKKGKKRKARDVEEVGGEEIVPELVSTGNEQAAKSQKSINGSKTAKTDGIKNSSAASVTAKVLEEQERLKKKRKMEDNKTISSLFSSRDQSKPIGKSSDFMSRGFTIPAHQK